MSGLVAFLNAIATAVNNFFAWKTAAKARGTADFLAAQAARAEARKLERERAGLEP